MVWVFGIVFLTLVLLFAYWLSINSRKNREKLENVSRNHRIVFGVIGCILSFGSAYGALTVATPIKDWNSPPWYLLTVVILFMLGFMVLQVLAMMCLISIATESETK